MRKNKDLYRLERLVATNGNPAEIEKLRCKLGFKRYERDESSTVDTSIPVTFRMPSGSIIRFKNKKEAVEMTGLHLATINRFRRALCYTKKSVKQQTKSMRYL